jgi:hypothetical protein
MQDLTPAPACSALSVPDMAREDGLGSAWILAILWGQILQARILRPLLECKI